MIRENELTKLYYSIGEVAEMFDVNTSLIRFWEKEFKTIKPKKNNNGNRKFTPSDILEFQKIHHLVKVKGFTLDGAKKALKDKSFKVEETQESTKKEIIERLERIKERLLSLKD
ncbi:MAG: MerR family transcriptional regulator [Brumimicrobium sp.]